ncbi:carbonic anhydrase [Kwoniella heveanensis BCC8398]|uniref:Carbonic anhydrase n=1 Tax=Kwoniella heveanensis BCC8398 TaxID=1296120 RepID=A0A1B9GPC1_9TREE|nr:carbonic anhydrase [Kwoniella heveanensis BCC8398]
MPFHAEPLQPHEEIDIDLEHSLAAQKFPDIRAVLEGNRWWARKVGEEAPETWAEQVKGQAPNFLWIGCADSRVPEVTIMARKPGEVFVQRNVANQFQPKDDASQALLNYAIMNVGVCHVIVVGHTGCGGCIAAYDLPAPKAHEEYCDASTPLTRFLDPIIRLKHSLPEGSDVNDLIRENVKMSVRNVIASPTIQNAWEMSRQGQFRKVYVHGWLYDLSTGLLIDLNITQGPEPIVLTPKEEVPPAVQTKANGTHSQKDIPVAGEPILA